MTSLLDEFKEKFRKRLEESNIIHPKQLFNNDNKMKISPYFIPFIFK